MLDDVFIRNATDVGTGSFVGAKAGSVTVGTSVINWSAEARLEICNVTLSKCSAVAATIGPVILRDCRVEACNVTRHHAYFYGTAFSNCTLHGNCGRIWIDDASKLTLSFTHIHEAILEENRAFYQRVELAIDISDAWFSDLEIWGIPLEKVRTDPDRQVKCSFGKAMRCLDELPSGEDNDSAGLLRVYVERCREKNADGFLVASAKSGKMRERFLRFKALCEENDLLL